MCLIKFVEIFFCNLFFFFFWFVDLSLMGHHNFGIVETAKLHKLKTPLVLKTLSFTLRRVMVSITLATTNSNFLSTAKMTATF